MPVRKKWNYNPGRIKNQYAPGQKFGRVRQPPAPKPDAEGRVTEGGTVVLAARLTDDFVILTDSNRLLAVPPKLQKELTWMQRVTACYLSARDHLLTVAPRTPTDDSPGD